MQGFARTRMVSLQRCADLLSGFREEPRGLREA